MSTLRHQYLIPDPNISGRAKHATKNSLKVETNMVTSLIVELLRKDHQNLFMPQATIFQEIYWSPTNMAHFQENGMPSKVL